MSKFFFISLFNEYHRNQLHSQNKNINTYFYSYISEEITADNKITFNTDKQVSAICARKVLECFFFLFFSFINDKDLNSMQHNAPSAGGRRTVIKMSLKKVQSSSVVKLDLIHESLFLDDLIDSNVLLFSPIEKK